MEALGACIGISIPCCILPLAFVALIYIAVIVERELLRGRGEEEEYEEYRQQQQRRREEDERIEEEWERRWREGKDRR